MRRGLSPAARTRLASAAWVGAWLAAARIAQPAPDERAALHYVVVAALGYGHLLGATQLGRESSPGRAPAVVTRLAPVLLVASFAPLYAALVARSPGLVIAALAASVWHTVENDLALPAALRTGPRLGPLAWSLRVQLPALAAAALTGAAGALALAGRLPLAFGDVFAAAMLHHLVSWLLVLRARQRALATSSPAAGRRLGRRLLALHAPPALAAGALLAAPEAPVGRLLALFFAPSLYLFFAAAHVGATALARVRPSLERSS